MLGDVKTATKVNARHAEILALQSESQKVLTKRRYQPAGIAMAQAEILRKLTKADPSGAWDREKVQAFAARWARRQGRTGRVFLWSLAAVVVLVVGGGFAIDPWGPRFPVYTPPSYTTSTSAPRSSDNDLAFVLYLAGAPNTYGNCATAFDEMIQQPNSGYQPSDRSSAISSCVDATQPNR